MQRIKGLVHRVVLTAVQRRLVVLSISGFLLLQIIWLLLIRTSWNQAPTSFSLHSLAFTPNVHVVCEIGALYEHDVVPSLWLENPLTSVYRFVDSPGPSRPRLHQYRLRDAADILDMFKEIFHCDLISVMNVVDLDQAQVVTALASLRPFASADTPVVAFGLAPERDEKTSIYIKTQKKMWESLQTKRIIEEQQQCVTDGTYRGWCTSRFKSSAQIGALRPTDIPHLSPDLVSTLRQRAINHTVLLTPISSGMKDLLVNYECGLRRVGVSAVVYQPLDEDSVTLLQDFNRQYANSRVGHYILAHIDQTVVKTTKPALTKYREEYFIKMMKWRFALQVELLLMGFNVLISDLDIAYVRNPFHYFTFEVDLEVHCFHFVLAQLHHLHTPPLAANSTFPFPQGQPDTIDWIELKDTTWNRQINGGFYMTRSTDGGLAWMSWMKRAWVDGTEEDPTFDDQQALFATATNFGCYTQYTNMFSCKTGRFATFRFLDPGSFATGHLVYTQEKLELFKTIISEKRPLVIFHANGHDKIQKMRAVGAWYDAQSVVDLTCAPQ